MVRIDLGCGHAKRPGFLGLDRERAPGVDCIVDVERQPLPFPDRSVDVLFSAHCLEHLAEHALVFHEMSRVARNGALLEIWTPYAWTDEAFIYTHRTFFNEAHYLHPCVLYPEHWRAILGARWQLEEVQFVVAPATVDELARNGTPLAFALKYFKGVAVEFGVRIRIWHEGAPEARLPTRTWSFERDGERRPLEDAPPAPTPTPAPRTAVGRALARLATRL